MKEIKVTGEYITLGQFLKLIQVVDSGTHAKFVIADGLVKVNNEVDIRRGKKLRNNDIVCYDGKEYLVKNEN